MNLKKRTHVESKFYLAGKTLKMARARIIKKHYTYGNRMLREGHLLFIENVRCGHDASIRCPRNRKRQFGSKPKYPIKA